MNALDFFNAVTRPNITAAVLAEDDYRLVVNAILSVDAAYGVMFEQLKDIPHPFLQSVPFKGKHQRDSDFKNAIALRSREFEAVRDAAYATKHGRLDGDTRLVKSSDDISSKLLVCGLMACGDMLGGSAVLIACRGDGFQRAWALLRKVELFTDELMAKFGIGPQACPVPEYHSVKALRAASAIAAP